MEQSDYAFCVNKRYIKSIIGNSIFFFLYKEGAEIIMLS